MNEQEQAKPRALIIQPGAIGDCILTLPLAQMIKDCLGVDAVEMLGRSGYMDYFIGRSCIDGIRDMDSMDMHRLFTEPADFHPDEYDPLITAFANYKIIINFLDRPGSNFEQNLIFTANCSNPVEVAGFELKPPAGHKEHITAFYSNRLAELFHLDRLPESLSKQYLNPVNSDRHSAVEILKTVDINIKVSRKLVMLHPGSGGLSKCWHIDNFYLLAEILVERGASPVFVLGPAEIERLTRATVDRLAAVAPVISDLEIADIFKLLTLVSCFIGNDSGISHMAAASGISTIACFGPTDPDVYAPLGDRLKIFRFAPDDFSSPTPEAVEMVAKQAEIFLTS